jgi:hypothetical protein
VLRRSDRRRQVSKSCVPRRPRGDVPYRLRRRAGSPSARSTLLLGEAFDAHLGHCQDHARGHIQGTHGNPLLASKSKNRRVQAIVVPPGPVIIHGSEELVFRNSSGNIVVDLRLELPRRDSRALFVYIDFLSAPITFLQCAPNSSIALANLRNCSGVSAIPN